MTKQEFMAINLNYGLKCIYEPFVETTDIVDFTPSRYIIMLSGKYDYKPILHCISDLIKPIIHNEKIFIPNDKLNEIFGECIWFEKNEMILQISTNPFRMILKLIEWHFDIAGLIEKGEAIDVNTLDIDPYK